MWYIYINKCLLQLSKHWIISYHSNFIIQPYLKKTIVWGFLHKTHKHNWRMTLCFTNMFFSTTRVVQLWLRYKNAMCFSNEFQIRLPMTTSYIISACSIIHQPNQHLLMWYRIPSLVPLEWNLHLCGILLIRFWKRTTLFQHVILAGFELKLTIFSLKLIMNALQ